MNKKQCLHATYRLQLSKSFTLGQAAQLSAYFQKLGVSHLYLSPCLESVAGSNHGYDVTDPHQISAERGGETGLNQLADSGLPLILDIVPNHEFQGAANQRWENPELRRKLFDIFADGSNRQFYYFDLCALRMDERAVFDDTHRLILDLVKRGLVSGLRLDYISGLANPPRYIQWLKEASGLAEIWVEQILGRADKLALAVKGTVGYEFLRASQELFMSPEAEADFSRLYSQYTGQTLSFPAMVKAARREVVQNNYAYQVGQLCRMMPALKREEIEQAVIALENRTYVYPGQVVCQNDRKLVEAANLPVSIRKILLLEEAAEPKFVVYLQQVADFAGGTAYLKTYYRHNALIARNEMGIDASVWHSGLDEFHRYNRQKLSQSPEGMNSLETHDTFLSRDSRARLIALTHMSQDWQERVNTWRSLNRELRLAGSADGTEAPDANTEYRLYQALVSNWPISLERFQAYLKKSNREAGEQTSWANPNSDFESRVEKFVEALFVSERFLADFLPFVRQVNRLGDFIATAQVLLQCTSPGIADIYYGTEMRRLSLPDPDQRRDLDWTVAEKALSSILATGKANGPDSWRLFTIVQALRLRARHEDDFLTEYEALAAPENVLMFARGEDVIVEVPLRESITKQGAPDGFVDLLAELPFGLYERRSACV